VQVVEDVQAVQVVGQSRPIVFNIFEYIFSSRYLGSSHQDMY
jgi:hypothetical protein